MSKHTPGPWVVSVDERNGPLDGITSSRTIYGAPGAGLVAYTVNHGEPTEKEAANARLIAAAPDLLAALEALMDSDEMENFQQKLADARAAIAKAKGEA